MPINDFFLSNLTGGINFGNNNVGIDNNGVNGGGFGNDEGIDPDINCDRLGTCYDVGVHCKDTRIVVNVNTNQPFSGRIYALGRSETCNVDVINSDSFRLDLTMSGQDCNTQSVVSTPHYSYVWYSKDCVLPNYRLTEQSILPMPIGKGF